MEISRRFFFSSFTLLLVMLFVCVNGSAEKTEPNSRLAEGNKLQGLKNSSTADGLDDDKWKNEHAVDNPEEIASMVDMTIKNSTARRNLGYFSCGTGNPIDDCWRCNAMVRSSPSHYGWRTMADGDGISIFGSSHIWIDHNSLSNCADGLIDAVMGSTAITISNNYFTHHNEVMLLGHSDSYVRDKQMQVTIAYNHFGEGLIQRMPRCRHGYFHVVNNDYTHWEMYAIGGSANPTINSQGNRYLAPVNPFAKEVTKRVDTYSDEWKHWNWRSEGDLLLNGAYFTPSARASSLSAKSSFLVGTLTSNAGALACRPGRMC
ncbi:hypothetical protein GOBAR_DD10572 [Gossypium barbadense]|nr:hypothetical protein GOBAR_DD10572 [Gossypium barbadense]